MIDNDKLNHRDISKILLESEEYAYFKNEKFRVNKEDKIVNTNYNVHATGQEDDMNSTFHLKNIKYKFDHLNIEYDEIFDFYTKLTNKLQFCQNYMTKFNFKVKILLFLANFARI